MRGERIKIPGKRIWQRGANGHIVRDEDDRRRIRRDIHIISLNWAFDPY